MMNGIGDRIRLAKDAVKESFKEAMVISPIQEALRIYNEAEIEIEEILNEEQDTSSTLIAKRVFSKQ